MDFRTFTAGENDDDRRVDKIVRIICPQMALSEVYKAIRKGLIKVNDKKTSQEYRICKGDKISIAAFLFDNFDNNDNNVEKTDGNDKDLIIQKNEIEVPVLFHNENIIIYNKPRNMLVHKSTNSASSPALSLEVYTKKIYEQYKKENPERLSLAFTPGPLHRLDRYTTGIVAFSWSLNGARWFSENIKNHTIQKKYVGIVQGNIKKTQEWKSLIKQENKKSNKAFHTVIASKYSDKDNQENPDGKEAYTLVTPLSHGKINGIEVTYAEFFIKTGRHHQIRAQAAQNGYPLYGDTAYGASASPQKTYFLHAHSLVIPSNPIGLPDIIEAPLPADFKKVLEDLYFIVI